MSKLETERAKLLCIYLFSIIYRVEGQVKQREVERNVREKFQKLLSDL